MDKKLILVGLMGMNKDVINSKTAQLQAYEIKNFRLNATLDSNAFELTTERGTKSIPLYWRKDKDSPFVYVLGTIIGYCILNNYLVLFTKDAQYDRIYRLTLNSDEFYEGMTEIVLLYEGDKLEFDTDHLIDAIPYYETELIQKVYWIDGKNLPRVINIANRENSNLPKQYLNNSVNYDPYGFVLEIYGDYNQILVTKGYVGGMFHAGVIQYAYSFFNENAQETPVIDVTPLYYIAHEDRGEKPDTRVGCTFTLTLNVPIDFHDKFDYIRFYSIYRSALDTTPLVKVINEVETNKLTLVEVGGLIDHYELSFIDDNTLGYVYDALLLLIRNNKIVPLTFNYKDGKLFFGNFKNEIKLTDIKDNTFSNIDVSWERSKTIEISPNELSTFSGYENEIVPSEFNVYNYKNQLQHNSQEIKTFKGNEYYHLGVLLLDKYGNWSLPYYIRTDKNTVFPKGQPYHYDYQGEAHGSYIYPIYNVSLAETTLDIKTIISNLSTNPNIDFSDYIRIRPVVSFPTAGERAILCQGIVNPTVFNLGLRVNGTCHALASWFFRPYPSSREQNNPGTYLYKRGMALVQWENYAPLFNTKYLSGEILCMYSHTDISPSSNLANVRQRPYAYVIDSQHKILYDSYYFIDTLICTLNSPDIEFDTIIQNVDTNEYGLFLVGSSRFVNNVGKYNIIALNPNFLNDVKKYPLNLNSNIYIRGTKLASGFNTEKYLTQTYNNILWQSFGGTIVSALNCWYDDACNLFTWEKETHIWNEMSFQNSYVVYPWLRKYLNNFNNNQSLLDNPVSESGITTESGEPSLIIKKILGNLRFCYTDYCTKQVLEDIDYLKLFNSEETQLLKMKEDKLYCGNIDLLITCNSYYLGYYARTQAYLDSVDWKVNGLEGLVGYPLMLGLNGTIGDSTRFQGDSDYDFKLFGEIEDQLYSYFKHISPNNRSIDPIWIRYKSTPHFVFKFSNYNTLPILGNSEELLLTRTYETVWGIETIRDPKYLDIEHITTGLDLSYLWIADIYNPKLVDTLSDFNLLNRVWLPCGESKPLNSTDKLVWSEGDTFFQRYDCLKTYPFSNDDYQSVVEIGSFMLETRVNLDGRYDTNRGLMDNTAITKENFNLINPVYSQMNNFFLYRILDDRFNNKETEYKNRITWTLDKQNGDDVDLWTRVTELGIIDLDGDKGKVTKIERFDNNLYIFQDKGVARLNYNDNIQIPTEGNIPIEVVNSGFINGKRYISENQGLQDKWCSKSTPYGIFFKDDYSKALCTLKYDERRNPVVAPLSYGSMLKWTELNIDDIYRVNYDNQVNEVLFMLKNKYDGLYSLHYSPLYQVFTAFYDYKDWIANYNNSTISLLNDNSYYNITYPVLIQNIYFVRRHEIGEEPMFNYFYDSYKPYWIKWTSVVDNYDCIFNNIYYKGDLFNKEENSMNDNDIINEDTYSNPVFNEISVSNDYQSYELEGNAEIWKDFKPVKKFRIWRGAIPRLTINGKYMASRIRNHWVRIGLRNNEPDEYKAIVRDLKVEAFF